MRKMLWSMLALSTIILHSCRPEDPGNQKTDSDVHIKFETVYDGAALVADQEIYTHKDGSKYSFSLLRYYISHITFIDDDGNETNTGGYDLVDAFDATYQDANFIIPKKRYSKMRFYVGIPQPQNSQSSTEGELNVALGMSWTWAFGYIFFKHEGAFRSADNSVTGNLSYHLGTDTTLRTITIPIDFNVDQDQEEITLSLNIGNLYRAGKAVDFQKMPSSHSAGVADLEWMTNTANILSTMFEVKK